MTETHKIPYGRAVTTGGRLVGYVVKRGKEHVCCDAMMKPTGVSFFSEQKAIEHMTDTAISIRRYDHGEGDFWQRMGPFFASMQVQRELGLPMRSDDSFQWWVAFSAGEVVGFCAAERQKNGVVLLRHAWVQPARRENGIYERLFDRRLDDLKADGHTRFRTTTSEPALSVIKKRGFEKTRMRGRYTIMELNLDSEDAA